MRSRKVEISPPKYVVVVLFVTTFSRLLQAERDEDVWKATLAKMEQHDSKMAESWKDELNNLLVFVSGFEAFLGSH